MRDPGFLVRGRELRRELDRVVAELRAESDWRAVTRAVVVRRFLRDGIARYARQRRAGPR